MKRICLIIVLAVFIGGCLGSDMKPPEKTDIPSEFKGEEKSPELIKNGIGFWKKFENKELNRLIESAFKNSPDIKSAMANLESATQLIIQSDAVLYPQVNISGAASRTEENKDIGGGTTGKYDRYSVSAEVSYELDFFGRIRSQRDIALLSKRAGIEELKTVYISLASNICEYYYTIAALNIKQELLKKNLALLEKRKEAVEERYRSGISDYSSFLTIKKTIKDLKSSIKEVKRSKDLAVSGITLLSGKFRLNDYEFDIKSFPQIEDMHPEGIPSEIIKRRPDVKSAFIDLEIKNKEVAKSVAERFPSFNIAADLTRSRTMPDPGSAVSTTSWSLAGNFLAPVLDWGRRKAAVKEAEADWEASFYKYRKKILTAFREVEDSINNISAAGLKIEDKEFSVRFAKEKEELAEIRYRLGSISYPELLSAKIETILPERELADLKKSYISYVIELAKASGAGWAEKYIMDQENQK